jgi:hypothetical protein
MAKRPEPKPKPDRQSAIDKYVAAATPELMESLPPGTEARFDEAVEYVKEKWPLLAKFPRLMVLPVVLRMRVTTKEAGFEFDKEKCAELIEIVKMWMDAFGFMLLI